MKIYSSVILSSIIMYVIHIINYVIITNNVDEPSTTYSSILNVVLTVVESKDVDSRLVEIRACRVALREASQSTTYRGKYLGVPAPLMNLPITIHIL